MIDSGKVVKACAQNMSQWTPELHKLLLAILNSTSDSSSSESIREVIALTDQMLNGIDVDDNGKVDPVSGDCGVETAYEYAYRMTDMPIMPAGLSDQLTQVAGFTPVPANATQINSGTTPVVDTPQSDPTKEPKATKKPKKTKDPGGGGGDDPPPKKTKKPKK